MEKRNKLLASIMSAAMLINAFGSFNFRNTEKVEAAGSPGLPVVEALDRSICAINTGRGMMVSWRYLANDPVEAVFRLYRDNTLIYTSNPDKATSYLDASGSTSSKYRVDTVVNGAVVSTADCSLISNNQYLQVNLSQPGSNYSPNDCTVGDVDGDGQYEIFVKWDPDSAKDNAQSGVTDKVYIDCYKLNGTQLWRIDLGVNIRAGAHYTQMLVADFDLDGKAEMTCKTADGTIDGKGKVIGDASKDYRNTDGYILSGPEYYTLFDGETGAALDTVNYNPPRGTVSSWGDNYGNRVDRFLGAVAYLDGVKPSAVTVRGYYTRITACAYDVINKKLVQKWFFDSNNSANAAAAGNGNHNCMPADVDGDGKQEIILGAACIDHDGTLKWSTKAGHGDALHVGDLLPDRPGLEAFMCHENSPYGVSLLDAKTGEQLFRVNASGDTGRCCAGNVWAGNDGAEFWGAGSVYGGTGKTLSMSRPAENFLIYWDGDLERETLEKTGSNNSTAKIEKINVDGSISRLFTSSGDSTINGTKGNPCLSADIFGDWREELILKSSDNKSLRIYCTPYTTDYRITSLMHDPQYRNQVAGQNVSYNQPPHPSFYLGTGRPLPPKPDVKVNDLTPIPPPVIELLNGTLIKSLERLDTLNYENWSIQNNFNTGDKVFGDRDFTFTSIPDDLTGSEWIRVACDSKNWNSDAAKFTAGKDISVYIGLDSRIFPAPSWMSGWIDTNETVTLSNDVIYKIYKKDFKEGTEVTLGINSTSSNTVMYTIFVKPVTAEQLNGTLIKSLVRLDTNNYDNWSIQNNLKTGGVIYGDREYIFTSLPDALTGSEWIRTACDSKNWNSETAYFTAGKAVSVFIGLDTRVTQLPDWLADWMDTGAEVTTSNDVTLRIYQKDFSEAAKVTLGGNGGPPSGVMMYTVFVAEKDTVSFNTNKKGDINQDCFVDSKDLIMLKEYILGKINTLPSPEAADLNGNGVIDNLDNALLKREILKSRLPA